MVLDSIIETWNEGLITNGDALKFILISQAEPADKLNAIAVIALRINEEEDTASDKP